MHDFGFRNLRIVNDYAVPFATARSAVDASDVLSSAAEFRSVAEAVADCSLVIGTTAVGERALQHPLHALPEAAAEIDNMLAQEGRVALLFGSEKTGLSNDELSHCHWLLTIPMHRRPDMRHPSMNLGQAAAVCLYELVRQAGAPAPAPAAAAPEAREHERLTALLAEVLDATGYRLRHPAHCGEAHLRRLVLRMNLDASDVPVWLGILRQILWRVRGSPDSSE